MTPKKLNFDNYNDAQYSEYEQLLRKKYTIVNNYHVVVKQGFVYDEILKVNSVKSITNDDSFKIRQLVNNDIKNEVAKIHSLLDNASEEIYDLVQFTPSSNTMLHLQAELIADNLFVSLSNSINALAQKAYERFAIRLNENSDDKIYLQFLNSQNLPQNEVYAIIDSSLENLKNWFFDNIDSMLGISNDETQKSFFSDAWDNITNFFSEAGNKINQLIQNIVSIVQTETKKIIFQLQGYEKYKIIPSGHPNICEKCQHMAGKVYRLNKMQIGTNAPPFHTNCQCTIVGTYTPAPMTLADPSVGYDREAAVAYAKEWAEKFNPDYPNFDPDRGDCANFISQCLLAGGFEMNGDWYCESGWDPRALYNPNHNWKWSILWSGAKEQYEYLKNSNIVTEEVVISNVDEIADVINNSGIKVGDIMYLKFDQDRPHHATIISKIEDGMIFYTAHTEARDDQPLWQFFNDKKMVRHTY